MDNPREVTLYTDGSWRGSTKTGGYAAFLTDDAGNYMLVGDGRKKTSISRMELTAVVVGLSYVKDNSNVTVVSDSQYAVNIINKWLKLWAKTNFVKSNGVVVCNKDIVTQLYFQIQRMNRVQAVWVKAHTLYTDSMSLGNDICDHFAVKQAIKANYRRWR